MMTTSKPLFIYLQRPDTGDWVTVGRYAQHADGRTGVFRYAPSYMDAALPWSIDPVNLPLIAGIDHLAHRYRGLHDVLRDACPDSWGRMLLQREHNLADDAHDSTYLRLARNGDRWGALAVGVSRKPSVDVITSPKLLQLEGLAEELLAMYERRPPVDARLRRMLMATPSLGGARPKGTLQDGEDYWLVKPILPSDTADIPSLEHFTLQWGATAGMHFARSVHHHVKDGLSVVRICRFDRHGQQRTMTLSGASLLSAEYPGGLSASWSYPRLAQELKRIGAPLEDRIELFERMVFNAIVGNDDDHPRNHATIYHAREQRWRLSPAFDVVPNPDAQPRTLTMQLSEGRFDIARDAVLTDAVHFGFDDKNAAATHLNQLLARIADTFPTVNAHLSIELRQRMRERLASGLQALQA
ncbi:type II toxin-antitoxin system HipA family toxin [Cupriavidus basilensis]|uniref:type II toxin-antitoxin system HipA family toxin n=1 Tax=Cupriavidus basilensis TaxID=68895 RepID=UPI0039F723CD